MYEAFFMNDLQREHEVGEFAQGFLFVKHPSGLSHFLADVLEAGRTFEHNIDAAVLFAVAHDFLDVLVNYDGENTDLEAHLLNLVL